MELDVIRAIQRFSTPVLDVVMELFTLFGEQMLLAAVFCAIYWCLDKKLGRYLAATLGLSVCLNGVVKDFFKVERMFGQPGIISHRVETATGYSFPSGHTQTAAAFWGGLACTVNKAWVRRSLILLVLLIGFSRMYLGVHYPSDVLGGLVCGAACAAAMYFALYRGNGAKLAFMLCGLAALAAILLGESEDTFKAVGMLAGILAGLCFEAGFVDFSTDGVSANKKLLRYVPGMALVGAVYIAPKLLLPESVVFDACRYALTVFTATGLWPYLFKRFRW